MILPRFAVLFLLVKTSTKADSLDVFGSNLPVFAAPGEDVVLNCHVELPPPDLEVQWTRADNDMLVHLYVEGDDLPPHYQYRGRTELFYEEIPNGNVSLKLHKVTLEDRGSYRCTVSAQGLSGEAVVELTVTELHRADSRVQLQCAPRTGEEFAWMKGGEEAPAGSGYSFPDNKRTFIIEKARNSDCGVYTCVSRTQNTTYQLQVEGIPSLHIGTLVTCALAVGVAVITAVPAILWILDITRSNAAYICFFLNWLIPPIAMFISFILWGVVEGFTVSVGVSAALHLLPIPHVILLAKYHDSTIAGFFGSVGVFEALRLLPIPHRILLAKYYYSSRAGFTGSVGVSAALHLLPTLHQLLKIYDDSTIAVKYHYAVMFCGTTILAVVNSATLISGVALQAGKDCRAVIDIQPFVLTADSLYLISLLSSIIAEVYLKYKEKKEETEGNKEAEDSV